MLTKSKVQLEGIPPQGGPAIKLLGVTKAYRLYPTRKDQLLDLTGLGKLFPWRQSNFPEFRALNGIDLTIRRGERVGIIGRNGAGKTTLLKIISGLLSPSNGHVDVHGDVQALMHVGAGFHPEFTGLENIRASLVFSGLTSEERKIAEQDIVEFCELGDFLMQPLKTYSLGMQSRLQFACATAIRPEILVVDEILGAGDAYFNVKSAARMRELTHSGCTLLLVSHSSQHIIQYTTRSIWIDDGTVRLDGTSKEVVNAYEVFMAKLATESNLSDQVSQDGEVNWLTQRIVEKEAPAEDKSLTTDTLDSGLKVSRWASNPGVKIRDLSLSDESGERRAFYSDRPITISLILECELQGAITVCTHIAIFDEAGVRVAWITSPPDTFEAQVGMRREAAVSIESLLLSAGNYTLSVSVFDGNDPNHIDQRTRFDLLARCYDFGVIRHEVRDRPIFYHPSDWTYRTVRKRPDARAAP